MRAPGDVTGRGGKAGDRRRWRALVPAIALLAGVLFATSAETAKGTDLRAGRTGELAQLIVAEERAVTDTTSQVTRLQGEVDTLERQAATRDQRVAAGRKASGPLGGGVGLAALHGP